MCIRDRRRAGLDRELSRALVHYIFWRWLLSKLGIRPTTSWSQFQAVPWPCDHSHPLPISHLLTVPSTLHSSQSLSVLFFRALDFIHCLFLELLVGWKNGTTDENLSPVVSQAYEKSLKQYHGWMTQKVIGVRNCTLITNIRHAQTDMCAQHSTHVCMYKKLYYYGTVHSVMLIAFLIRSFEIP